MQTLWMVNGLPLRALELLIPGCVDRADREPAQTATQVFQTGVVTIAITPTNNETKPASHLSCDV